MGVKKWAAEYNDRIVDEKLLDENIQGAESINYLLNIVPLKKIEFRTFLSIDIN